jgi:hypothetical protein
MASFNILDAAGKGYRFTWTQRRMLLHYGFWPLMLKIASISIVGYLGLERNLLRQGLCMLPATFFEGWMVAIAVRFAVLGESRPEPLNPKTGGPAPAAVAARRAILGGTIIYMLINLTASLSAGVAMTLGELPEPQPPEEPTAGAYFAMMLTVAIIIYVFRFLWIHIPVIMEIPVRHYLRRIEGMNTSFYMIGLWLLCILPIMFFLSGFGQLLMGLAGGSSTGALIHMQFMLFFEALCGMAFAIIAGVSMAFAIREMMAPPSQNPGHNKS